MAHSQNRDNEWLLSALSLLLDDHAPLEEVGADGLLSIVKLIGYMPSAQQAALSWLGAFVHRVHDGE